MSCISIVCLPACLSIFRPTSRSALTLRVQHALHTHVRCCRSPPCLVPCRRPHVSVSLSVLAPKLEPWMEWPSSKPLSQADERCVFGLSLETLFLTPIVLMLPRRHPLLAIACFMLSTKVHPAPLCPGTDHRACKIPQACTPASGRPHRTGDTSLTSGQPGRRLASRVQVFDQINAAMLIPRHGGAASSFDLTINAILPPL